MSRLDYITIAIVAICILAIIFLVYKMTDLFNGGETTDKIETVQDSVELEDDTIYDYEIDDAVDTTASGQPATDNTPTTDPATTTPSTPPAKENVPTSIPEESEETTPATKTSSGGKFMVFGGTFTKKSLANEQVTKLKKLGYENADVEIFDRGKYAVVLVDRFEYMADAERLVKKLQTDGITCYIKMKDR